MIDTPEYLAALAEERRLREEIYLDLPRVICGVKCKQITPYLLAVLFRIESPFVSGGEITHASVLQFLWACSTGYSTSRFSRWMFFNRLFFSPVDLVKGASEIGQFMDDTFLDAPYGTGKSVPYVSSIAWLELSMKRIMGWDSERTLHTPLRRIYQLIRCNVLRDGGLLVNARSDAERDRMMHELTRQNKEGN